MAPQPVLFLLLLWGLTLLFPGVTSSCNITCSTDYKTSLNCSCSGSVPTHSVLVSVKCSGEDTDVNGTCEVKAPQSWCVMYPEMFIDVVSIGTNCTTTVSHQSGSEITITETSSWYLSNVVKLQPPFDVHMTNSEGFYNITWSHQNQHDTIQYMVRIRESKDLSQDPIHSLLVEGKHLWLENKTLQPCVHYTLDVKARHQPGDLYEGPWSEWSSAAESTTTCYPTPYTGKWWYILLSVILILGVMLGFKKTYLQKKIHMITYIPKPDEYFKPLYHNYGGNFKDWVHPVFNEYDYLKINTQIQTKLEKQHDVLQWNDEKQNYSSEGNETRQDSHFLHVPQPHSNSLLFSQDSGSSHSTGHVSIHTVTLSGEEEYAEEGTSHRSYQDGESFEGDNRNQAGYNLEGPQMFEFDRQSGILPRLENQISDDSSVEDINFQPGAQLNEPERVSLDSFASNEQSEDGYPRVDLDTIDSGFGECGSPVASDSNIAEQIHSFHEDKNANSNYVKQWMVCSTLQEESRDLENELHEMQ